MDVFEDPESTREEILAAAYRTLCEHGYADLTMERIGEEFDKSVSLVYHHYDGKDDLLLACLEFMLENYRADTDAGPPADPREAMETVCDRLSLVDAPAEAQQFVRALVELRGQAPHNEAYRDYFTRSDRFFEAQIATIIQTGVEQGVFRAVDPERTARMIHTVLSGAFFRYATSVDDAWLADIREELRAYNERTLYLQDGDEEP
ncbi:MAG: TetR/AcrR family transcriptional regulator [Natronomonas sp.]|jgi:AcrR family transcriptional regulator|uniref:TetR/AcrR family transcriptional regulator n=1 Tax=Natronomonas sp. TaxID=2184060 RepID=UPI0028705A94|nr:TetR/AcrR family transcriptional regulator [Natronomonas sp.]MDR9381910.1 TetR/AcrR family transcriptional regulator [Natronomonas sp.]MDR9430434.1 TetR/AcrR family transcriptional regulator [Natronomonas sp.]